MSPRLSRDKQELTTSGDQLPVDILDSRQQPAWHVLVLGFFTFNMYVGYWAFKTYADLKRESIEVNGYPENPDAQAAGIVTRAVLKPIPPRKPKLHLDTHTRDTLQIFSRVSPGLRGIGMMVPILQIYLAATLTIGISNLLPDENSFPRRNPLGATLLIAGAFVGSLSLGYLPQAWMFFATVAMIPIAVLQHWLNKYWLSVESEDLLVRHGFNLWEMLTIIVGAMLMGFVIAGFMIGVKP
jgi:hypothetical protein